MAVADNAAPDQRRRVLAFAALILGATAMGASPIFVRLADVGPYASAFWRTFLALPFLWAWARLEQAGAPRLRRRQQLPPAAEQVGVALPCCRLDGFYSSFKRVGVGN